MIQQQIEMAECFSHRIEEVDLYNPAKYKKRAIDFYLCPPYNRIIRR